jgi:hypothetical protein
MKRGVRKERMLISISTRNPNDFRQAIKILTEGAAEDLHEITDLERKSLSQSNAWNDGTKAKEHSEKTYRGA